MYLHASRGVTLLAIIMAQVQQRQRHLFASNARWLPRFTTLACLGCSVNEPVDEGEAQLLLGSELDDCTQLRAIPLAPPGLTRLAAWQRALERVLSGCMLLLMAKSELVAAVQRHIPSVPVACISVSEHGAQRLLCRHRL